MIVVDYNGTPYKVSHIPDKGRAYWSYHDLYLNPILKIEVTFAQIAPAISVNEVRDLIYNAKVRWEGLQESIDFKAINRGIKNAKTVPALIDLLINSNQVYYP